MNNKLTATDLFCGAGGLSLGFQNAGFNILSSVDFDPKVMKTYKFNIKTKFSPITKKIQNFEPEAFLKYIKIKQGELDILIGSPPCKGFSMANRQSRNKKNKYNRLFFYFLKYVLEFKPRTFLFENVLGLKFFHEGDFLEKIKNKIEESGYFLNEYRFKCEDYGIPQKRERLIVIGGKSERLIRINLKKRKKVSVRDAIDDLPIIKNGNRKDPLKYRKKASLTEYQREMRKINYSEKVHNNLVTKNSDLIIKRYKHIKQGGNWKEIPSCLMENYSNPANCHSSIYYRLREDKPSITICNFRKNMIIHPNSDRGLSVREAARIQSFPDNFIFKGGIGTQQQQVANAVPPKLSTLIALELKKNLMN